MKLLATSIAIAASAHCDQFQRNGSPYILHPLHVMRQVEKHPADWMNKRDIEIAMCVSVMHDVLEDSDWTVSMIYTELMATEAGSSVEINRIMDAVVALTKVQGEDYSDYLQRVKADRYACVVKLADLRHNSDLRRLPGVEAKDIARLKKYSEAYIYLAS